MKLIFSGNFAMNIFILLTAAIQCVLGAITSLPGMLLARWQHGENWREVSNLTSLEKYTAKVEKEYSEYLDHTPFYMFDYIGKIKGVWETVFYSKEGMATKLASVLNAILWSLGMIIKAAISAPIRAIYTAEANLEPDTVKVLIKDPNNELEGVINRWEKEKDSLHEAHIKIEEIYSTPDGYKFVSIPRYRPFTKICGHISETAKLELLEIGGQKNISIDVLLDVNSTLPAIQGTRMVYKMERLQDPQKRHYETYHVALSSLKEFLKASVVEYIHE
jgi:hypothetical protein